MKMSKSIKDYKDAMDSVKISDSFYRRTEVLLNESSEIEIVKSTPSRIKLITRSAIAVAACLVAAVGIKTVVDNRAAVDTTVVTEFITQETTVVTVPVTVPETASPVIDRPEAEEFLNDSGVLVGDMPAIPEAGVDEVADEAVKTTTTAALTEETFTTEEAYAIPTVDEEEIEEEAIDESKTESEIQAAETMPREGYPEMAEPQGVENIPPLREAATDKVGVKITPYFDFGSVVSGENPVSGLGCDYQELISTLSEITSASFTTENENFKSVFLIQLSEQSSGLTYYSIYVTDASTLVVTRHDIADQQRLTYELSSSDYNKILLLLYTNFGASNEFNYFLRTEIGK